MKRIFIFWAALLASFGSSAQTPTNALDTVIVSENRIREPYGKQHRNIEILDSKQIEALPVKSTNELLSYVAGVDLRQRGPSGSQADISIDGSTFDQVLVLVNGVKMSDPQTGHHTLNIPIPLSAIDHVEIVRGPAARTYGVNALAGAVNIVTKSPARNEIFAQAYSGSSFKKDTSTGETYFGWGAQAAASLAADKHAHILSVAHDRGNGYRYNTGYEAYRLYYQNEIRLHPKHLLQAMGGYVNNNFGANAFYAAPADKEATEKVQTAIGSIGYVFTPNSRLRINPRLSYRYNNDDYIFVRQDPSIYRNIHESNVLTAEVQSSYKLKKGTVGAGIEYRSEDLSSTNLGKRQRNNLGLFAEYKHYFSGSLSASAGLYANKNSDYDWEVFPGIDAGYQISRHWKVFANATTGQRLPTYTDLYYVGPANTGNAALRPEYASYVEGGLQFNSSGFMARSSWFYRKSSDFIDWVRPAESAPWQPQNFQTIHTNGLSLLAEANLSSLLGLSDDFVMHLNGNYTWLDPVIDAPENALSKYAIEALRHQASLKIRTLLWHKLETNLAARYQQRINANDYTLLDLRLGYRINSLLFYVDLNNLLDTQYKEIASVPLPGRWWTFGIRFQHPGQ